MCHLYSAGLPPQCLVELQFQDRLCIGTRIVQQPIMPGFRCQVYRLVPVCEKTSVNSIFIISFPYLLADTERTVRHQ